MYIVCYWIICEKTCPNMCKKTFRVVTSPALYQLYTQELCFFFINSCFISSVALLIKLKSVTSFKNLLISVTASTWVDFIKKLWRQERVTHKPEILPIWVYDCNGVARMSITGGPPWWYRHRSSCHDDCPSHRRLTQLLLPSTATWEICGAFYLPVPPQRRIEQLVALLSTPPCTCHGQLSLALWQT